MKQKFSILMVLTLILSFTICLFKNTNASAEPNDSSNVSPEITVKAPVALLMEFSTGEIIYGKNINEKGYPASMTKMMGLFLILRKIKDGSIKYDDIVTVSSNAASMGGSQVFLEAGEQITVNDLFKAICIASANDAIVALGEYAYGSEENFINEMNKMAKKLGMNDSHFVNPTGFYHQNH